MVVLSRDSCRHCTQKQERKPGSVTFPGKASVMSKNVCSLGATHLIGRKLTKACPNISRELRAALNDSSKLSFAQTIQRGGTDIQGYLNRVVQVCGIRSTAHGLQLPDRESPDVAEAAPGGRAVPQAAASKAMDTSCADDNASSATESSLETAQPDTGNDVDDALPSSANHFLAADTY